LKRILLILLFLVVFATPVFATGTTSETKGDFKVRWTPTYGGIGRFCYDIEVQNLNATQKDFNFTVLFENTSFKTNEIRNIVFKELIAEQVERPIYGNATVYHKFPLPQNKSNEEYTPLNCWQMKGNKTHYACNESVKLFDQNVSVAKYKEISRKHVSASTKQLKWNYDTKTLPNSKSKEIKDDFGKILEKNGTRYYSLCYEVPIKRGSLGKVAIVEENTKNEYHPWFSSNFTKCRNINVTNPTGSALTDFPVFISLPYDSDMQSDYDDIRFVNETCDNGGSELYYEFVENNTTDAEVWVNLPNFATGINEISVYYGNSTVSSASSPLTWNDEYLVVMHMNDNTTSTVNDSTSYGHGGSKRATNSPLEVAGKIQHAQNFSGGSNDYVQIPHTTELNYIGTEVTMEAWINVPSVATQWQCVIAEWEWTFARRSILLEANYNDVYSGISSDGNTRNYETGGNELSANTWHHIGATYKGSTNAQKNYADGVNTISGAFSGGINPENDEIGIGSLYTGSVWAESYTGKIDEVRISNVSRSTAWLNMSYLIVENQSNLVSIGDEQTEGAGGTIPTITLIAPLDNNVTEDNTPEHNFSFADAENNTASCTLYYNSTPYGTNSSTINNTNTNITANATISDGVYKWWVNCTDSDGTNKSAERTITIDSTRCNYPASGEWLVDDTRVCRDENITLNGNLTIRGGDLTFENVTLWINNTVTNGTYQIWGNETSRWFIEHSLINATNPAYRFRFRLYDTEFTSKNTTWDSYSYISGASLLHTSNYANITNSDFYNARRVALSGSNNTRIENCTFLESESVALYLQGGAQDTLIRNVTINNSEGGVWITQGSNGTLIENSVMDGSTSTQIVHVEGASNTIIRNNLFMNSEQLDNILSSHNALIENNTFYNIIGEAILASNSDNVTSIHNTIETMTDYGIYYEAMNSGNITNNSIRDTGIHGIYISNTNNVLVHNNTLDDIGDDGILSLAGNNNVNITNNVLKNITGDYAIIGNTLVEGNIIDSVIASYGISSEGGSISHNTITGSVVYGITIGSTSNVVIANNTILSTNDALSISGVDNATITSLRINDTTQGVRVVSGASNLTFERCEFNNTAYPFNLDSATNVNLTNNSYNNEWEARDVYFESTTDIYYNNYTGNFSDGTIQTIGKLSNISSTDGSSSMDLRLYYKDADVGSLTESSLRMYIYNGSNEWELITSDVDTTNNYVNASGITTFSWFGVGAMPSAPPGNTAPVITLISPVDFFNTSDNAPEHNFSFIDLENNTAECTLYYNSTPYGTNTSAINNTNTNITVNSTISDGVYKWWINCTDGDLENKSAERTITIDTVPPTISYEDPTPNNETFNYTWAYINVSSNEPIYTVVLEWNGSNESMSGSGTLWFLNKSSLSNGNYTFRVYGNDSAFNLGYTGTRWVFINYTTPPPFNCTYDMNYGGGQIRFRGNDTDCYEDWNVSYTYRTGGFITDNKLNTVIFYLPIILVLGVFMLVVLNVLGRGEMSVVGLIFFIFVVIILLPAVWDYSEAAAGALVSDYTNVTYPILDLWYNLTNETIITNSETVTNGVITLIRGGS